MLLACQKYLSDRLTGLLLADGYTTPYRGDDPGRNIFFDELPRDFLKDNDYAVCCLPLIDRSRKFGKLISSIRTAAVEVEGEPTILAKYTRIRRRFTREITFRCLLYGLAGEEIWGSGESIGLAEQFQQGVSDHKLFADADNSAILVEPQEIARPWDSDVEMARKLSRPILAIVRVQFLGGIQKTATTPIIPGVTITPTVS
ncbi:MAG: hypothetical protein PHC49_10565 [Desulfuromonadaceae bacterium]|nr:hypothetical protein [Desulfuromonadaceae bacterium]